MNTNSAVIDNHKYFLTGSRRNPVVMRYDTRVLLTGTFDLFHAGHVEIIKYAKAQGDYLMIALDSDERVAKRKGSARPIVPQGQRKAILEALRDVDKVVIFNSEEDLLKIVRTYKPDVRVVGDDYVVSQVVGLHGQLQYFPKTGVSTTKIIEKILNRSQH